MAQSDAPLWIDANGTLEALEFASAAKGNAPRGGSFLQRGRRRIMSHQKLKGRRIAILATDGFELVELIEPRKALHSAEATTHVISPQKTMKAGEIRGWNLTDWGQSVKVDKTLSEAKASDYDALVLPGGVMNPDELRIDKEAVAFVKEFVDSGKPIATICHGPWTLIETGMVRGREMTSWPSLQTDLRNAGAVWKNDKVVVDRGLVTSRKPDDIPAFSQRMVQVFEDEIRSEPLERAS
jgi:protease I